MCCTCLKPGETKLDSNLPNPNPKTRYCCFSSLLRQRWCALTNFQKLKHLEVKVTPLHQTTDDFFIERVQRERERGMLLVQTLSWGQRWRGLLGIDRGENENREAVW
jgi:hypothetical protein